MQLTKQRLWVVGLIVAVVIAIIAIAVANNNNKTTSSKTTGSESLVKNNVFEQKKSLSVGKYLTDPSGKTLYISDADKDGVSNCDASCLQTWPLYGPKGSESLPDNLTVIKRSDGTSQYAYKGKPLYYFISDTSPGDITGNGLHGFHVATL